MDYATSTMTVRLSPREKNMIQDYASLYNMNVSELVRTTLIERIEDELDLKIWEQAKAKFDADAETISAEEIAKKYL